jgi:hypothetical protein
MFIIALLAVIGGAGFFYLQVMKTGNSPVGAAAPKDVVRQPTAGGEQAPLWPENVALAKPDSGEFPESTQDENGIG